MAFEPIESVQNERIKIMRSLASAKGRRETGLFLVEGDKLCREALQCGLTVVEALVETGAQETYADFLAALERAGARVHPVPRRILESVCTTQTPQRLVLSAHIPSPQPLGFPAVALDGVQDPGNCGAILRTCDAAGFSALLGPGCADPYAPKMVRATMGSLFRVPFRQTGDLAGELDLWRQQGVCVAVAALDGEDYFARAPLPRRSVLVVGSEGRGVSAAVAAKASHTFRLPMVGGAESLNAAVATGVLIYDLLRTLRENS